MTRFGCVVLTAGRRPDDLRAAVESLLAPGGRGDRRRRRRQRLRARGRAGRRPRRRAAGRRGDPGRAQRGRPARRAASCCSSSTTTRELAAARRAGPRGRARSRPSRGWRWCSSPSRRATAARAAATGCRACASATRARSSEITVVWEGARRRAARRCSSGSAAGRRRLPLRARGRRPRLARDGRRLHDPLRGRHRRSCTRRHTGTSAHGYSYYFGARNRVWLARRHLPLPLGVLYVIAFALRTVPRLKSRRAVQEAARGYRDGLRGPGAGRSRLRAADAAADDPRRATAHHVETEDPDHRHHPLRTTARTTSRRSTTSTSRTSSGCRRSAPYIREAWRRRAFAFELARTQLRAQHFNTVFGQLWLVLNPLMLALRLLHPRRHPARRVDRGRASSPTSSPASSPTTSSPTRCATARSRSSPAGG